MVELPRIDETETIPLNEMGRRTDKMNKEIEASIRKALLAVNALNEEETDLRNCSINTLRSTFSDNPARVAQITNRLWMPDTQLEAVGIDIDSKVSPATLADRIERNIRSVLNPVEVDELVVGPFALLMRKDPEKALALARTVPQLYKNDPRGYMSHMRKSGHDIASLLMAMTRDENRMPALEGGTVWDIASGPGNTSFEARACGLISYDSKILLSDINEAWSAYSKELFAKRKLVQDVRVSMEDAGTTVLPEVPDLVLNAMGLQWFANPERTIRNIARQLKPGGQVYVVGEVPLNAVANTVEGLVAGFHIFDEGGFEMPQLCQLFEQYGLNPMPRLVVKCLAMPEPSLEFLESLSSDERKLVNLSRAYAQHLMVCIGFHSAR